MKFRTSIYSSRRAPQFPTYHRTTRLDLVRAERKRDEVQAAAERVMQNAILYGVGVSLVALDNAKIFKFPSSS